MSPQTSVSEKSAVNLFFDRLGNNTKYKYIAFIALSLLTGLGLSLVSVLITSQGLHAALT